MLSISERLAGIELLLQQSTINRSSSQTPISEALHSARPPVDNTAAAANLSAIEDNSTTDKPAAGYNDANVEFSAATSFLEQAITWDFTLRNDSDLNAALQSLRNVIDRNVLNADAPSKIRTGSTPSDDALPGWDQVRAVLNRAEGMLGIDTLFFAIETDLFVRHEAHAVQLVS